LGAISYTTSVTNSQVEVTVGTESHSSPIVEVGLVKNSKKYRLHSSSKVDLDEDIATTQRSIEGKETIPPGRHGDVEKASLIVIGFSGGI
jgi:hypothetical protein